MMVGREHAQSPAAKRLEAEITIPAADIEDGLPYRRSAEIAVGLRSQDVGRAMALGDEAVPEVDGMELVVAGNPVGEL
ncbi:MAG TPA: hypothetical protein VFQ31_08445, partial [Methyloceanibacter sp.]|nr:hypothetical protein [Methyloceanibacter sp.]